VWRWEPSDIARLRSGLDPTGGPARVGAIPRGRGRSYGDAAHCSGGLAIATDSLSGIELNTASGLVTAEAGVTLKALLDRCVPEGWILPVVPGTQHVSVGGAIASDVHGKNHGTAGAFGAYVRALGLLTSDGELVELTPDTPGGLFDATVGGMGLTGVIAWAQIQLMPTKGALLSVDTDRVDSLDETLAVLSGPGGPHRVAWLDLLGSTPVRGIVTRAQPLPADADSSASPTRAARAVIPPGWPGWPLRTTTARAFNALRYRLAPRSERNHPMGFGAHMFPLDALVAWPRLYGSSGFRQYQFVVPTGAESTLERVITHLRAVRVPPFLAILKDMGEPSRGPLSFPMRGWTLALDLPRSATGVDVALDQCDELVAAAGGRVYLSKDDRLRSETVAAMYPRLSEWRAVRDAADPSGLWRSNLAVRTGLVD